MKILVVDDSPSERMLLQACLKRLGHEVISASNGEQGVEQFAESKPDLVLLDVVMPGMDGYDTARSMRAAGSDWVPIIFLSGRTESEDIVAGIEAGGDDYLAKPCNPTVLAAKMGSMQRIAGMRARLLDTSRRLEEANAALARAAHTDGLTGIGNRRALDEALIREIGRSTRNRSPVSVVLADVDNFKLYNDRHGHLAGDECLRKVAHALRDSLKRSADFIGRYGGEEFCLVLPDTAAADALHIAERARLAIMDLKIPAAREGARVTASFGVATHSSGDGCTPEAVLSEADEALYTAKHDGRNRTWHSFMSAPKAVTPTDPAETSRHSETLSSVLSEV